MAVQGFVPISDDPNAGPDFARAQPFPAGEMIPRLTPQEYLASYLPQIRAGKLE